MIQLPQSKALSNLSLTPLIDVVFLLVIFFLVSSRFSEEERRMDINIPETSIAKPIIDQPKELIINISFEGKYFIGDEQLTEDELIKTLKIHWNNNPTKNNVIVRADRDCRFEPVFFCIDACREVGITDYCVTAKARK